LIICLREAAGGATFDVVVTTDDCAATKYSTIITTGLQSDNAVGDVQSASGGKDASAAACGSIAGNSNIGERGGDARSLVKNPTTETHAAGITTAADDGQRAGVPDAAACASSSAVTITRLGILILMKVFIMPILLRV